MEMRASHLKPNARYAAARADFISRAVQYGRYFIFSHVIVRTLIRPLTGSGVGLVERCTRSPSKRAMRV